MPYPIAPVRDYTLPNAPSKVLEIREPVPNISPFPTPSIPSS